MAVWVNSSVWVNPSAGCCWWLVLDTPKLPRSDIFLRLKAVFLQYCADVIVSKEEEHVLGCACKQAAKKSILPSLRLLSLNNSCGHFIVLSAGLLEA